jgi:hypothetical protein
VKSNCSLGGIGAGEIQVQLMESGLFQNNWDKVAKSVGALKEIGTVSVSYDGWLVAKVTKLGNMRSEKTDAVIKAIQQQIVGIVEHKLERQQAAVATRK